MAKNPIDLTQYAVQRSIRLRFYKYIQFCEHGKSCTACHWLWQGSTNNYEYGRFHVCILSRNPARNLYASAHRFMYTIAYGHTSKLVLHTCDIPSCCNYNHFFSGTDKDNVHDKERKGRGNQVKGEKHTRAKILSNTIWHMKVMRESGFTYAAIGKIVGVTDDNVSLILRGKTWKHIKD